MKKLFLSFLSIVLILNAIAQEESVKDVARNYMRAGDWDNAILVLNRAIAQEPNNLDYQKDLAMTYYYKKDYAMALKQVEPMLDRNDADEAVYQIAGNVYKALEEVKEADKLYKKGLKKFPRSGPLYSEYGELLWAKQDYNAIKEWEKGIEMDPSFAGNYYNAALYYYYTHDKIWTLIYGEIFVNMEYLTERATQMKKLLLSAYKEKLYTNTEGTKEDKDKKKNQFGKAVLNTFNKQANLANRGMNSEVLNMIRTKFILDWYNSYGKQYPFKLFEYHQQLIKEGMFEAYNQWLFNSVENLPAFDLWTKNNSEAYTKFTNFQKGRIFKVPVGQYYHN